MIKLLTAIVVSLLAGVTIARIAMPVNETPGADSAGRTVIDSNEPLDARIAALERALREERDARQVLQDELTYLYDALQAAPQSPLAALSEPQRNDDEVTRRAAAAEVRRAQFERRNFPEVRAEQLVAGGFPEDQAAWIARRESELQMEALQARYEARVGGDTGTRRELRTDQADRLRAELGEQDYERYLEASGLSTSASIMNVLETSPAQRAGLRAGDQIVRYGGERVFNTYDLNRRIFEGQPGETVLVDVRRDGTTFQVTVPRGPLGVRGN